MHKVFTILLLIPFATAGIVDPIRNCGSDGAEVLLNITDCEGYCRFQPGTMYNCSNHWVPSTIFMPSLILRVEICTSAGLCMQIINMELPHSAIQPGLQYTVKYSFIPNDVLSGQTVEFMAKIVDPRDMRVEICVAAFVDIL